VTRALGTEPAQVQAALLGLASSGILIESEGGMVPAGPPEVWTARDVLTRYRALSRPAGAEDGADGGLPDRLLGGLADRSLADLARAGAEGGVPESVPRPPAPAAGWHRRRTRARVPVVKASGCPARRARASRGS
jgi:hypothetical protein